jgi:hypothetical protein
MGISFERRLGSDDIRQWRVRHWLTRPRAALWFGLSLGWIKAVEAGTHAPRDLHGRIEAVFSRYAALEAYARAVREDMGLPDHGPSLRRAVEALRAAGMQASHVERLMAQPYDKRAR